jgi:hypothetical protein
VPATDSILVMPASLARRTSYAIALAAATLSAGCTWFHDNPRVLITSQPAGAQILLDGHDTGETTPHVFDIASNFGSDHVIELRRTGYRPEKRRLMQFTEGFTFRLIDAGGPPELPPLLPYMSAADFFLPFGVRGALIPGEVYVKLYREDEPLLGFDLLRAQAADQESMAGNQPIGSR